MYLHTLVLKVSIFEFMYLLVCVIWNVLLLLRVILGSVVELSWTLVKSHVGCREYIYIYIYFIMHLCDLDLYYLLNWIRLNW